MTNEERNKLFGFDADCPNDIPAEEMMVKKSYSVGDRVSISEDRSHSVDGHAILAQKRVDLAIKWHDQDGELHEVWEGWVEDEKYLFERNLNNKSESEFTLCPDFDADI
jgi:hypothetical protein